MRRNHNSILYRCIILPIIKDKTRQVIDTQIDASAEIKTKNSTHNAKICFTI